MTRVAAVVPSLAHRAAVAAALAAAGCTARMLAETPPPGGPKPDLWLVETDLGNPARVAALNGFVRAAGGTPVLVASPSASLEGMRALLRAGVADVLPLPPPPDELRAAIAAALGKDAEARKAPGAVVCFLKAGGGCGATTLATQAACRLGKEANACLVDLDIQFGGAALHLDLPAATSVLDVLAVGERLDGSLVRGAMVRHSSGLDVLPAPTAMHPLDAVSADAALRLFEAARHEYAAVFVELPAAWTAWTRALLAAADRIVLVLLPSVPSIRHARRQLDTLAEEGLAATPLTLVLNRVERGPFAGGIPLGEIEKALGRKLDARIGDHRAAVAEAVDVGRRLESSRGGRRAARELATFARLLVPKC
ncbi:MAG: hypothetical protein HY985_01520 [Magnetospirillum sp.]|nr:hypothetical protein [Magnetospirillum sp.]